MKNGVECYKDFFPYFKALKTNCEETEQNHMDGTIKKNCTLFGKSKNFEIQVTLRG